MPSFHQASRVRPSVSEDDAGSAPSSTRKEGSIKRLRIGRKAHPKKLRPDAEFVAQATDYRSQLRQRDQSKQYLVNPDKSVLLPMWDMCTTSALVYTALVTPVEIAYLEPSSCASEPFFIINRLIDSVFILDMVLQFFVMYRVEKDTDRIAEDMEDGHSDRWVLDRRKIVRHYVCGWFLFDLVTVAPSVFDIIPVAVNERSLGHCTVEAVLNQRGGGSSVSFGQMLRVMRVLRLTKLARLIRGSRVLKRWKSRISLSFATTTMLTCLFAVLLAAHWYACIFALQAVLADDPARTWLGAYSYCHPLTSAQATEVDAYNRARGLQSAPFRLLREYQCPGLSTGVFYFAAFSWSCLVITGTGGTDFYPAEFSLTETAVVTSLVLLGALIWTQVLAAFCDIATNSDPAQVEFRRTLDDLNRFCASENLPTHLRRELRQYFHQSKHVAATQSAANVIYKLSASLQAEVVLRVHSSWLRQIWFMRGAEQGALVQLALRMQACVFAPNEVPPAKRMYVIHRGIVLYGGRVLASGKIWGDDMIMYNEKHHSTMVARCMTYVEAYALTRDMLLSVVASFPEAYRKLRRGTIIISLRRGMPQMAQRKLQEMKRENSGDGDGAGDEAAGRRGTFLDLVVQATEETDRERRAQLHGDDGARGQAEELAVRLEEALKMLQNFTVPSKGGAAPGATGPSSGGLGDGMNFGGGQAAPRDVDGGPLSEGGSDATAARQNERQASVPVAVLR